MRIVVHSLEGEARKWFRADSRKCHFNLEHWGNMHKKMKS